MSAAVHHLEDCVYLPEVCPLGCVSLEEEKQGEVLRMERRHIPGHVKDSCPLREIVCEFCEGKVKASEMNPHLEDCEEFPLDCPNGCSREGEDGVREVKRKDIPVHLDNHCPLQKVQCPYWDHGCREEMERRHTDTHEREFLHIHFKLSLIKTELKQNESTQVTQRLQHNLDTANEKIAVQELQFTESLKLCRADLNAATKRIAILEEQNSDKDQIIASMIPTLPLQLPTGRLEWKVEGVKQKIRNRERYFSDPFYVGLYKCQGCIDWDFWSRGNVFVIIHIIKGDFHVKLPIRYKRTVVLINQINGKDNVVYSDVVYSEKKLENYPDSFKKPNSICTSLLMRMSFISNISILEEKYCKQDSITLHISVEVLPSL